jgi:hypothetical protein
MRASKTILAFCFSFAASLLPHQSALGEGEPHSSLHALVVGIDGYVTSRERGGGRQRRPKVDRGFTDLRGAVNDARSLASLLQLQQGPVDLTLLVNQEATRDAILKAIGHLVNSAKPGERIVFFFAGHGSQVPNSRSEELDHLDETLVPVDAPWGASDLRDKELRRLFNRILDRGARLTVIVDACHSGSVWREPLPLGEVIRRVRPATVDAKDGADVGPRPEDRGAILLSATQDEGNAFEISDDSSGVTHGAFSLSLLRSLSDSPAGEPVEETFLRARAILQSSRPTQEPVLAGNTEARRRRIFGESLSRKARSVVAISRVEAGGRLILQGGWVTGLNIGTTLRLGGAKGPLYEVVELRGPVTCVARASGLPTDASTPIRPTLGALLEIEKRTASPGPRLRVWMPSSDLDPKNVLDWARNLENGVAKAKVKWVEDPTEERSSHVVRWRNGWEILDRTGQSRSLPKSIAGEKSGVGNLGQGDSVFLQLPSPRELVRRLEIGPGSDFDSVLATDRPDEADLVLVGRLTQEGLQFCWMRPRDDASVQTRSGLPSRSSWHLIRAAEDISEVAGVLLHELAQFNKINGWFQLTSPIENSWAYSLVLQEGESSLEEGIVRPGVDYRIALRVRPSAMESGRRRFVYVFGIDPNGRSVLLFPRRASGSDENRLPLDGKPSLSPIVLSSVSFEEPLGIETLFLISSEEPIANPWVLEWEGVRKRGPEGATDLEEVLSLTGGTKRSPYSPWIPALWSIERKVFVSAPNLRSGLGQ